MREDRLHIPARPSQRDDRAGNADLRVRLAARLAAAGVPAEALRRAAALAKAQDTSFTDELVAAGRASQADVARAVAAELGLDYGEIDDFDKVLVRKEDVPSALGAARHALVGDHIHGPLLFVAPRFSEIAALQSRLRRDPALARRMRISTPDNIALALRSRHEAEIARLAIDSVDAVSPRFSAREVATAWQGTVIGIAAVALPYAFWLRPVLATLVLHILVSAFFLGCVMIRVLAALAPQIRHPTPIAPIGAGRMPVYTVLVPLRDEAEVVGQLIVSLDRLHWPRSRLDVRLVCEAGDTETLAAIAEHALPPSFTVVTVPPLGPQTKPKALDYGLRTTTGEFVAVYDAEDRPDPDQLLEAWQCFAAGGEKLACVQAPLVVANFGAAVIARLFAFEYAALFRGLLPWLSRHGQVVPLGGSSNHFRGLM